MGYQVHKDDGDWGYQHTVMNDDMSFYAGTPNLDNAYEIAEAMSDRARADRLQAEVDGLRARGCKFCGGPGDPTDQLGRATARAEKAEAECERLQDVLAGRPMQHEYDHIKQSFNDTYVLYEQALDDCQRSDAWSRRWKAAAKRYREQRSNVEDHFDALEENMRHTWSCLEKQQARAEKWKRLARTCAADMRGYARKLDPNEPDVTSAIDRAAAEEEKGT